MAEIKSTMDIIMEKLNKIKISEEDKREIIKKEIEETAKRLVATYKKDRDIKKLFNELNQLGGEKRKETERAIISECIKMITPYGEDNEIAIKLIKEILKEDVDRIKEIISLEEERLSKIKERIKKELLDKLRKRDIYGSAVIPNIETSPLWKEEVEKAKERIRSDVNNLISKL